MDPAAHVRVVLAECRRRGVPFGDAWMMALQSLPRPQRADARAERLEWLSILAWSKPFYAMAYEGRDVGGVVEPLEDRGAAAA